MEDYSSSSSEDLIFMGITCLFLLQLVVGIVQVLAAFIRTIIKINKKQSMGALKTYWIIIGIYFFVFVGIYCFREILSNSFLNPNEWYSDYWKWNMGLIYTQIVWIFIAWGIAIWYCIKIVFVKSKKEYTNVIN